MALRGSLDDVPIVDVLQFVHMSGKSGALSLESPQGQAWIEFSNGNIAFARGPGTRSLGEIVVERALVSRSQIETLLDSVKEIADTPPLGRLLLDRAMVSAEQLAECVRQQVHETMLGIAQWSSGDFYFTQGSVVVADEIRVSVEEVLPLVRMNTQHVLLEAARLHDEKARRDEQVPRERTPTAGPSSAAPTIIVSATADDLPPSARIQPAPEFPLQREPARQPSSTFSGGVVLVGFEKTLLAGIRQALTAAGRRIMGHVPFTELERVFPTRRRVPRALVFLWRVRGDTEAVVADQLRGMETVISREPGATHAVLLTGGTGTTIGRIYGLGVRAVLPLGAETHPELDGIISIVDQICKENVRTAGAQAAELQAWQQAKSLTESMHQALQKANIALEFMRVAASTLDRATLFLCKRGELFALGAFGRTASGKPMAESVRGLAVQIAPDSLISKSLAERRAITDVPSALGFGPLFFQIAGPPKVDRAVLVPLVGPSKTIGVLYADNGQRDRVPGAVHALEIAATHASIAYENAMLRLRLSLKADGSQAPEAP